MDTYEKKYNEALNWMRELYPGLHVETKEDAEHYFPELRESEGAYKRIEQLIRLNTSGAEKTHLLAYLEKQKKQKPIVSLDTMLSKDPNLPKQAVKESQKPAEWSEEDEENIGKLHRLLVICQGEKKFIPTSEYEKLDRWLKSLRPQPHWKPSEEQMEAMEYVIRDYREDSCNATANHLQAILEHLKNM